MHSWHTGALRRFVFLSIHQSFHIKRSNFLHLPFMLNHFHKVNKPAFWHIDIKTEYISPLNLPFILCSLFTSSKKKKIRQLYTKFTFIQQCDMASDHYYNQVHYVQVQGTWCWLWRQHWGEPAKPLSVQAHALSTLHVSVLCTNLETRTRFVQYAKTACVVWHMVAHIKHKFFSLICETEECRQNEFALLNLN